MNGIIYVAPKHRDYLRGSLKRRKHTLGMFYVAKADLDRRVRNNILINSLGILAPADFSSFGGYERAMSVRDKIARRVRKIAKNPTLRMVELNWSKPIVNKFYECVDCKGEGCEMCNELGQILM